MLDILSGKIKVNTSIDFSDIEEKTKQNIVNELVTSLKENDIENDDFENKEKVLYKREGEKVFDRVESACDYIYERIDISNTKLTHKFIYEKINDAFETGVDISLLCERYIEIYEENKKGLKKHQYGRALKFSNLYLLDLLK